MDYSNFNVFTVLAADDSEQRTNQRVATRVIAQRAEEQFGKILASESLEDYLAKLDFVAADLSDMVVQSAAEYGVESKPILEAIEARFRERVQQPATREASAKEARRPKLCPYHSEVVDISLAQGEPRAGFDAMAQHAWGTQHCKGSEYEGGRCNFKRDMVTSEYWDAKAEQAQERRLERERQREQEEALRTEQENAEELPEFGPDNDTPADYEAEPADEQMADVAELPVAEEPQAEVPMAMAASSDQDAPLERSALRKEAPGGQHREEWGESGSKRNRQYEHIKEQCMKDGGSEERCEEMAARTVNKTRSEHGETKSHRQAYDEGGYGDSYDPWGAQGQAEKWCQMCQGQGQTAAGVCAACGGNGMAPGTQTAEQYLRDDGPMSINNQTEGEFGNYGYEASTRQAEALKTVDVDEGSEAPSPKIDKRKWTPDNLSDPDAEMEGSPHPTRTKDITETIEPSNDSDRFEETDAVLEKQDVEKDTSIGAGKGGTFPKGNGANPVTTGNPLTSATLDPHTNPVREALLEDDGFEDEPSVLSAIASQR